ncbi:hypothetical protein K435DRAFT_972297 [Dendrothele bispora CBS 962.96]|uniref:Uncharacterized protein n=1 Tax=Dendrothele bispora (strain CBS 962.96) TaxID=1314807 RepID=A0A4V4HC22_DENBC|nr:hypothetical protein K435DRAFT_972297 [Dendrothele bispora CBS 962.96]
MSPLVNIEPLPYQTYPPMCADLLSGQKKEQCCKLSLNLQVFPNFGSLVETRYVSLIQPFSVPDTPLPLSPNSSPPLTHSSANVVSRDSFANLLFVASTMLENPCKPQKTSHR